MSDLLTPRKPRGRDATEPPGRPLALSALLAAVASPAVALLLLWAVGLVGWFAADGGSHGTTRSVLRIAADAWLLSHGGHLQLDDAVVTASPLGLTLACGYLTYRFARWAGETSEVEDLSTAGLGTVVLAGGYGVVALLTSLLASAPAAQPGLGLAFVGGAVLGAVAGGVGLLRGAGLLGELRQAIPVPGLSVAYGAVAAAVLLVAAGALLTAVALTVQGGAAANVAETLGMDLADGVLSLLVLVAIAPNAALLAVGYLLGSGFSVGAGTMVAPQEVLLGPLPAVPVLAALPPDGWTPGWVLGLLAVPVLAGFTGAFVAGRLLPTRSYQAGGARGLGAGTLAALLLTVGTAAAGGSIGPGRMTQNGVDVADTLVAALLALAPGAALAGVLAAWWARRHEVTEAVHPDRPGRLTEPPAVRPLAAPTADDTEPIHLPPVTVTPIAPSGGGRPEPGDLSTEKTIRLGLGTGRSGGAGGGPTGSAAAPAAEKRAGIEE